MGATTKRRLIEPIRMRDIVGDEIARRKTDELMLTWLARDETSAEVDEWLKLASLGVLNEDTNLEDLVNIRLSPRRIDKPRRLYHQGAVSPTNSSSHDDHNAAELLLPSLFRKRSPSVASSCDEEEWIVSRWRQLQDGAHDDALPLLTFAPLAAEVCQLPTIVGPLIYNRTADSPKGVTLHAFLTYWRTQLKKLKRRQDRLFAVVAKEGSSRITRDDWEPLIKFVVATHPGLAFLEQHVEFQQKYALTVATRIFYRVNLSRTGSISRRELAKANPCVVDALFRLESTDDVNSELAYFSYEHFYVLYCQFWELDSDKDGKLQRTDLLKYGGHRLSRAIVDRVFEAAPRPSGVCGAALKNQAMTYGDFIYFMLSEEDKATEASLRYWFACVDVDGDDIIDSRDAKHFYDVQAHRMECLGHEVVPLDDVLCQMADLLDAKSTALCLTVKHFLDKSKINVAGVFFDALFSLDKFVAFEQRDPFAERLKRDDPFESDWDRFAAAEYSRLATDDDDEDDEDDCSASPQAPDIS